MRQEEFASVVLDSKILATDEIIGIIKYLNSVSSSPVGFPEIRRLGFSADRQRCCRFSQVSKYLWVCSSSDDIDFSVDQDMLLHGLCLFGSGDNSYFVNLNMKDAENDSVVVSKNGQFFSELFQSRMGYYYGLEVMFDKAVVLRKNTRYCVQATISGSWSLRGGNAVNSSQESNLASSITCPGVTFTFMNSDYLDSGSNVAWGQFAEFLFSL